MLLVNQVTRDPLTDLKYAQIAAIALVANVGKYEEPPPGSVTPTGVIRKSTYVTLSAAEYIRLKRLDTLRMHLGLTHRGRHALNHLVKKGKIVINDRGEYFAPIPRKRRGRN